MPLPVVKQETRHSVHRDMERSRSYLHCTLLRIKTCNPVVASFIDWVADRYDDPEVVKSIVNSCVMVYRLLESQAEANELEEFPLETGCDEQGNPKPKEK